MYRSLLLVIRPEQDLDLVRAAMDLAGDRFLMVQVVAEAPPPPSSAFDMVNSDHWGNQVKEAHARVDARAREIEAMLRDAGQRGDVARAVASSGSLADIVSNAARYVDLVFAEISQAAEPRLRNALITGSLFESGTPVLFAPDAGKAKLTPEKVLIAWNAKPEATRAVKAALPLMSDTREVRLLLVDPRPSALGHGEEPGANLARFLGQHGLRCDVVKVPGQGRVVDTVLHDQVRAMGADMLVMGAYGHSRLRERVFGGTTDSILRNLPCATLMAH